MRYTMGSAEPRSFSRGKRGIAGTLVFTVFDRDALVAELSNTDDFYRLGGQELYNINQNLPLSIDEWDRQMSIYALSTSEDGFGLNDSSTSLAASTLSGAAFQQSNLVQAVNGDNLRAANGFMINRALQKATPVYSDEIPPFDVTISFGNEYGQMARIVIYGVEILNEGTGFSIDNVTSEKACTFVARRVDTMRAVQSGGDVTNSRYQSST